jgi:hypothetical protein
MRRGWRPSPQELVEWEPVGAWRPCPCCGATEGCSVAPAVGYVRCGRVCSLRPFQGGGWLHAAGSGTPLEAASTGGVLRGGEPAISRRGWPG